MIGRRARAIPTVGRLEYGTLFVGALACLVAKRAGVNEAALFAVWLLLALSVRRARNRGVLDRLVARYGKLALPEQHT